MVHDFVMAAKLWVFPAEGVQAVRARHDDLRGLDFVEHLDVLHSLHLEEEFVPGTSSRISVAGLALAEHHEFDPGHVQEFGNGFRCLLRPILECSSAANPEQILDVCGNFVFTIHAEDAHGEVDLFDPRVAVGCVHPPGVALVLDVLEQAVEFVRELARHQHLIATHIDDVIDVCNIDRALLYAGSAGGATPQNIRTHHATGCLRPGVAVTVRDQLSLGDPEDVLVEIGALVRRSL